MRFWVFLIQLRSFPSFYNIVHGGLAAFCRRLLDFYLKGFQVLQKGFIALVVRVASETSKTLKPEGFCVSSGVLSTSEPGFLQFLNSKGIWFFFSKNRSSFNLAA